MSKAPINVPAAAPPAGVPLLSIGGSHTAEQLEQMCLEADARRKADAEAAAKPAEAEASASPGAEASASPGATGE